MEKKLGGNGKYIYFPFVEFEVTSIEVFPTPDGNFGTKQENKKVCLKLSTIQEISTEGENCCIVRLENGVYKVNESYDSVISKMQTAHSPC